MIEIQWNPSRRELRSFGALVLPVLLLVAAALLALRAGAFAVGPRILVGLAVVSVALGLVAPGALKPALVGLSVAGFPIAWLVSHAILGLIYFAVLTPLGVLMRLAGHDPLGRRFDRDRPSYWEARAGRRDPERYFRQF